MPDYSQDPFYIKYAADRRAAELAGEGGGDPAVATSISSNGDGWVSRTRPDGSTEWRPGGKDWAPPGFRWAIDPHDRWATGGQEYTSAADRRGPSVPKLQPIVSGPTHPTKRPPVLFDSGAGVRYRS
jgi:hypothetical protein